MTMMVLQSDLCIGGYRNAARSIVRRLVLTTLTLVAVAASSPAAHALIVASSNANLPLTAAARTGAGQDPGWANVGIGTENFRSYTYLGDNWVLTAKHLWPVGRPVIFETSSTVFQPIPNQSYVLHDASNPNAPTDLLLFRIKGDSTNMTPPDLPELKISSAPLDANDEVTFIGFGKYRADNLTTWYMDTSYNPPRWTTTFIQGAETRQGYDIAGPGGKRWGTNRIADHNNDGVLAEVVNNGPSGNVMSYFTKFDQSGGTAFETQVVNGDSGSAVFHKRENGQWELVGIVHSHLDHWPGQVVQAMSQPPPNYPPVFNQLNFLGVFGNTSAFADLSTYRNQIQALMDNQKYSIIGDTNLDGVLSGNGTGPAATDDVTAFIQGWGQSALDRDITAWVKGDFNLDGSVNQLDYNLLAAQPLPGDYNADGVVDAADHTVWRNSLGQSITLPNETVTPGVVTSEDFAAWKANFGRTFVLPSLAQLMASGGGAMTSMSGFLVPEPSTAVLLLVAGGVAAATRRRSK